MSTAALSIRRSGRLTLPHRRCTPFSTIHLPSKVTEAMVDANLAANLRGLGGLHELLGGFNYDHTNFEGDLGFIGGPIGTLDLARPTYNLAFGDLPPVTTFQTNRYETLAGYAQDQATYGRLHLLGAVRLTRFALKQVQQSYDVTYVRANPRVGGTFDIVPGVAPVRRLCNRLPWCSQLHRREQSQA